jgi:ribonuclease HI
VSHEFVVYTDGASRRDKRGGWGFAIWYDDCWWEECGGEHGTTNNRMELMGVIAALRLIDSLAKREEELSIQLWADSKYVLDGITEYVDGWKFRGWRTGAGQPLKNRDLWEILHPLSKRHDIEWKWVKGHSGVEGNERADRLAAQGVPPVPTPVRPTGVLLRRRTHERAGS